MTVSCTFIILFLFNHAALFLKSSNTTDILLDRLSAQAKPKDKATETSDNTEAKSDNSQ